MFCNQCGNNNPDDNRFCGNCGQALGTETSATSPSAYPPMPPGVPLPDARTDGKAVASLILGILGVTIFTVFAGLPAIILGHISYSNIKKSMGRLKGSGMAIAGLVMGYLSVVSIPLILIIAAIAIPNLLRSRMAANEATAVGGLRTVYVAAGTYREVYKSFPASLEELGPSSSGKADAQHADLIDMALASGQKTGYAYSYQCTETGADGSCDKYFVSAVPLSRGSTGQRSFCSAEDGIIRFEPNESCTMESQPLQ